MALRSLEEKKCYIFEGEIFVNHCKIVCIIFLYIKSCFMLASSFDKKDNLCFIQVEIANIMHHGVCTLLLTLNQS